MNTIFKRLPLPVKLMLLALLPLAFLLYLAIQVHLEKTEKINFLQDFNAKINQSAAIIKLMDECQAERKFSFEFIYLKKSQNELILQRSKTDQALQNLDTTGLNLSNFSKYAFLNKLPFIRQQVDEQRIQSYEILNYYTGAIMRMNETANLSTGNLPYLQSVANIIDGQKMLMQMVTNLSVIRANIYFNFTTSTPKDVDKFKSDYETYNAYLSEFLKFAQKPMIVAYQKLRNNSNLKPTIEFLDAYYNTGTLPATYSQEAWWNISTDAGEQLKVLQRSITTDARKEVSIIYNKENEAKNINLIFLIAVISLVMFFVFYTIKSISDSLSELKTAAGELSMGTSGIKVKSISNDAIGSLASSISEIDTNNAALAKAADAIGRGNFSVPIQPRSENDSLGHALVKMKTDLENFTLANEEKMWVQEGITAINNSLLGEKSVEEIAKEGINKITLYLHAKLGLMYINHYDNVLEYASGYAIADQEVKQKKVHFGETLIGQVAVNKEPLYMKVVPEDFVKISSAMGSSRPKEIIIAPLVHDNKVEGVIELGSFAGFHKGTIALLQQVCESIAIAIQSAKSRTRLQELLEETQSQSEELQAQHTELENMNAELEVQAEKLQASEEELKVQQEELLQANQELEERTRLLEEKNQLITERNLEIQSKAEQLALSTKYKSEFLANMSHELRTPLNSILLLSRLLSENNEKNLSGEQVEYANVIQSSGYGLLTLIDEILDLSRIESGKMELDYADVNLQDIIADMESLFSPVASDKGLKFIVSKTADTPVQIETDKTRIEQVLKNFISNALKFTAKGSVELNISMQPGRKGFVRFSVKDTGIGIAKEKQQLVFEAFQQADGSTRRKYGGTGLGLSISRELSKLLGADIELSSEENEGSTFTVNVPVKKPSHRPELMEDVLIEEVKAAVVEAQEAQDETKQEEQRFISPVIPDAIPDDRSSITEKDKVILIVEDDVNFAKSLLDYTHSKGYKGIVSVRGDEGVEMAIRFKPAGILLDIQLPVKDGWQVMEELKSNPQTRHIPVHIMSSYEVKTKSISKGAIDFINKPVAFDKMQEIFQKLEYVLNQDGRKVLIVEENSKHAKALAYFLETFDVSAEIRNNVSEGIQSLNKKEVDCVILDMGIPNQQSYNTLDEVKKTKGLENVPIIIFTGKSLSKTEEQRIKQYADSIVIKTAHSYQRILDEVSLFLHLVEENKNDEKTKKYKKLGALSEVLKNKKVLIADDDVRNIFSLTKALETYEMEVVSAMDGKEALKQLEEHPDVDIVLMDMMMPEMDGYETTKRIRKDPRFRNLSIIAVTAKAMTGDREKCINAGASDYITKPVDVDQLLSLLRVWLYDKN